MAKSRFRALALALSAAAIIGVVPRFAPGSAPGGGFPKPQGWVSDYAGVLDANVRAQLNQVLSRLAAKTGAELAVVTVPEMGERDLETYATELYAAWGIGKKGEDRGALILLALKERQVRIETGYGLEGLLPDGKLGEIIREGMIPHFRAGDYSRGLINGTLSVAQIVAKDAGTDLEALGASAPRRAPARRGPLGMLLPIVMMILLFPIIRRNPFLFFLLLAGMSGGRGGWSGGGFGGGFGGFGGGLSGGGGASGRW